MPADRPRYISASDLAEYAFCPRSFWYRSHPSSTPADPRSVRRSAAGERFHARTLRAERRRAEHPGAYAALLVGGVLLLFLGVAWWIWIR
jgi:CRISPR/Cas system-associated exonuclease Cas4 (RecB family)